MSIFFRLIRASSCPLVAYLASIPVLYHSDQAQAWLTPGLSLGKTASSRLAYRLSPTDLGASGLTWLVTAIAISSKDDGSVLFLFLKNQYLF